MSKKGVSKKGNYLTAIVKDNLEIRNQIIEEGLKYEKQKENLNNLNGNSHVGKIFNYKKDIDAQLLSVLSMSKNEFIGDCLQLKKSYSIIDEKFRTLISPLINKLVSII
jgi:hypothetical protein